MVEHALKCQRDALCWVFVFRRDLVNGLNGVSEQVEAGKTDDSVPFGSSGYRRVTVAGSSCNMWRPGFSVRHSPFPSLSRSWKERFRSLGRGTIRTSLLHEVMPQHTGRIL